MVLAVDIWNTVFPQRNLIVKVGQFLLSGSRRLLEALLNNKKTIATIKTNDIVNSYLPSHRNVNKNSSYFIWIVGIWISNQIFFQGFS